MDYATMLFVQQNSAAYQIDSYLNTYALYSIKSVCSKKLSSKLADIQERSINDFKLAWLTYLKKSNSL